jgi:transposase
MRGIRSAIGATTINPELLTSAERLRYQGYIRRQDAQVEAQITKLKLVKRQMYGRAKIDLLQARLVGAP